MRLSCAERTGNRHGGVDRLDAIGRTTTRRFSTARVRVGRGVHDVDDELPQQRPGQQPDAASPTSNTPSGGGESQKPGRLAAVRGLPWLGRWWIQALVGLVFVASAFSVAHEPELLAVIKASVTLLFGVLGLVFIVSAGATLRASKSAGASER